MYTTNINNENINNGMEVAEFDYECEGCGKKLTLVQTILEEDCSISCPVCGCNELKELVEVELVE